MPTYGINEIDSFEVRDYSGKVIMSSGGDGGTPTFNMRYNAKLTNIKKLCPDNIDKVIFNPPATIVIFKDGTKEVVKCSEGDEYSSENGFAQAMMNVMFGSRSQLKSFIRKNEIACEINKVE